MPNDEPMRATGEPPICHQGHVLAEAGPHDGARGREHLPHAGAAFGAFVADHNEVAFRDLSLLQALEHRLLAVKDIGPAGEGEALFARDLCDRTLGAQVPAQDLDVPSALDTPLYWSDHILRREVQLRHASKVLCQSLSRASEAVSMQPPKLQQVLHDNRCAANPMDVLHAVGAAGLEVRDESRLGADGPEVLDLEVDACSGGHGQEVKDCIGGAAESVHDDNGVLEGLLAQDVERLEVAFQERVHGLGHPRALILLLR
mmetsp:Transcript_182426/g.444023  ORF Transcript_182426/g.444023 Transcript_182426/m.444023 type:complete len:259 (-) Transcript_182426:772-1548(-)